VASLTLPHGPLHVGVRGPQFGKRCR